MFVNMLVLVLCNWADSHRTNLSHLPTSSSVTIKNKLWDWEKRIHIPAHHCVTTMCIRKILHKWHQFSLFRLRQKSGWTVISIDLTKQAKTSRYFKKNKCFYSLIISRCLLLNLIKEILETLIKGLGVSLWKQHTKSNLIVW